MSISASISAEVTDLGDASPFEGAEKLLEAWWAPSENDLPPSAFSEDDESGKRGLRRVAKSVWDSMLDEVQCKVLSVVEGDGVDAYLLSESSMFVWPHKIILKTCGTTTLLLGLPSLLRIASETCGFKGVWRCFYSRKTFMFPDRQKGPHKAWDEEMRFLDQLFENSSAYTVGRMNGSHWLLYLTPPRADVLLPTSLPLSTHLPPQSPSTSLSTLSASFPPPPSLLPPPPSHLLSKLSTSPSSSLQDQTLEILMSHLHPTVCASFYHPSPLPYPLPGESIPAEEANDSHALGAELSGRLGITGLFKEGTKMDSYLFSPCGYSMNAVVDDEGGRYATIHVTPEVEYSYASFETNVSFPSSSSSSTSTTTPSNHSQSPSTIPSLVQRVLSVFKPSNLSITLFVSTDEDDESSYDKVKDIKDLLSPDMLEMYARVDRIVYEFEGYSLVYAVFESKVVDLARVGNVV